MPPALPAQAPISNGAMMAPPLPAPVKVPEEPPKLKPMARKKLMREKEVAPEMPRLTRAVHWQKRADEAFTSLHVTKEHKEVRLFDPHRQETCLRGRKPDCTTTENG